MLRINSELEIDERELQFEFTRSPGPGGQNINKVSTAVQLRFNVRASLSLPEEVKQRLTRLAGRRITSHGVLIIQSRQYRSQEKNRQAAITRLANLIEIAAMPPKERHKTRPPHAAILRRLDAKRRRSEVKRMRRDGRIEG